MCKKNPKIKNANFISNYISAITIHWISENLRLKILGHEPFYHFSFLTHKNASIALEWTFQESNVRTHFQQFFRFQNYYEFETGDFLTIFF